MSFVPMLELLLPAYHSGYAVPSFCAWNAEVAETILLGLHERNPGRKQYAIYLDRVSIYKIVEPPDDWDGVFTHEIK